MDYLTIADVRKLPLTYSIPLILSSVQHEPNLPKDFKHNSGKINQKLFKFLKFKIFGKINFLHFHELRKDTL